MKYAAVIVGAGPGGLACATKLSANGINTLVIERKKTIGTKVCAGGITWGGLINRVPKDLIEDAFPEQYIQTRLQRICVTHSNPIIATVNRIKFGQYMAQKALESGVEILTDTTVRSINENSVEIFSSHSKKTTIVHFDYLIGADGSLSKVRKFLGIPCEDAGVGINYQIPLVREKMEWHLNTKFFKNGYGWIFPHKDTISIGAYADRKTMSAKKLKKNLTQWAHTQGIDLARHSCSAEFINFDYRGWDFGKVFLVGDAAGFASALTGEGIYPAIISGETVAEKIIDPQCDTSQIKLMEKKQKNFRKMIHLTGKNNIASSVLAELALLLLRCKILNFRHVEMGQ